MFEHFNMFLQPRDWLRICIVCGCVYRDIPWWCPPTWESWAESCSRTPLSSPLSSLKWPLSAVKRWDDQHALRFCLLSTASLNVFERHHRKVPVKKESFWTRLNVMSRGIANGCFLALKSSPFSVKLWHRCLCLTHFTCFDTAPLI